MTIDVRLQTLSDGAEELTVSKESVAELKNILNNSSIIENQNLIIERFEKEHSFYITLITILSILLTVFGIVPVVYGLFEKSESQKIYSELETLKRQYKEQLQTVLPDEKFVELKEYIQNMPKSIFDFTGF